VIGNIVFNLICCGFQQLDMDNKAPWQLLGEAFVQKYYEVFDTNREQLIALYAVRVYCISRSRE